ncbi:MAG: phosphoesterase [Clostridia bacterium]|nr:phosphoesterase [Clostridia bacterium]
MLDIHAHVLPGVDDGAVDEGMTQEMMRRAADAGIRAILCTPHVYRPEDQIRNRRAVAVGRGIAHEQGLKLYAGCELNYRVLLKTGLQELKPFCAAGTPCILIEFSNERLVPGWEQMISEILENGYYPIIAHPERYTYIQKDIQIAETMCALGCELQVDAGGLMKGMFSAERKLARRLLSQGMVSYIASDAHRPQDYTVFEHAYRKYRDEWPRENRLSGFLMRKPIRRGTR